MLLDLDKLFITMRPLRSRAFWTRGNTLLSGAPGTMLSTTDSIEAWISCCVCIDVTQSPRPMEKPYPRKNEATHRPRSDRKWFALVLLMSGR